MATLRDISAADEAILPQRPRLLAEDPPRRAVVGRWLVRTMVALVLALFGGVVWLAYQETTGGGEPPLIRAEAGPYKRAPDPAGKPAVEGEDFSMASSAFGDHRPAQRPEVILPRTAVGPRSIAEADPSLVAPPPAAAKPPVAAPVVQPPASLAKVVELPPPAGIPSAPTRPQPPAQLAAVEPGAGQASAGQAGAPKAMPTPPAQVMAVPAPEPAPRPAVRQPAAAPTVVAAVEPRPAPPPVAKAPPVTGPLTAPVTASAGQSGSWAIQLAALSSRDAIDRAWAQMRAQHPGVLGPLALRVAEIKVSSGSLYRLQAGTFGDRDAAARACTALKAQGKDCMVVAAAR